MAKRFEEDFHNSLTQEQSNDEMGQKVEKTLGPSGGELTLQNVKLYVPPGALSKMETITLRIINDQNWTCAHKDGFSPLVSCEPSGLKFNKPVCLTLPHTAYNPEKDWKDFTIYTSESNFDTAPLWADFRGSRDITAKEIMLYLTHFSVYGVAQNVITNT